jgi:hypothetical protein
MKKILLRTMLLAFLFLFPVPTMADVEVGVSVSLPPLIVFASPPEVVVIPETYVYVVPDAEVEIFFYDGWWWRPWEGRWYRSRRYDSGWSYYQRVPTFYSRVPSGWRNDYRERRWGGRPWNYQPIPHRQAERNWSSWKKNKHWEKQGSWGVQGLKPGARSQQPSQAVQQKSKAKPEKAQGKPGKAKGKPGKGQGKPDKGEKGKKERR